MKDPFDYIIWPALFIFERIFDADRRPEAQRFAIGCLRIFVFAFLLVGLLFKYFG